MQHIWTTSSTFVSFCSAADSSIKRFSISERNLFCTNTSTPITMLPWRSNHVNCKKEATLEVFWTRRSYSNTTTSMTEQLWLCNQTAYEQHAQALCSALLFICLALLFIKKKIIWQLGFLKKNQMNWTIKFSSKKFYSTHNFLGIWTNILMDCQRKETAAMKDKLGIGFHCKITLNFNQNEILSNWEILSSAHCWLSKWVTSIILNWECISIKRVIVGIAWT